MELGFVMNCKNCVEITARLHLYIDRELSAEEVAIVQQHFLDCPNCACRFHFDLHIKRLIHKRCTIERAPSHLREAVLRIAHGKHINLNPAVVMEIKADLEGY
jgi:mycothiol system anti-sigma-R factor